MSSLPEKGCHNCAHHNTAGSLEDAPPHCWSCANSALSGRGYPSWKERPGDVRMTATEVRTRRIPINVEPVNADPMKKQVGGNHYKDLGIQPLEVMKSLMTPEEVKGFLKGNMIKYSIRQGRKPGSDDAEKAKHYRELLAQYLSEIAK